jgi:hypothetical protein
MSPLTVALATEDELSEVVGERLILEAGMTVRNRFRRNGVGYLRANMKKWTQLVRNGVPLVLLADLDSSPCAGGLLRKWSDGKTLPDNLVLRVAVREVETWLLADDTALGRFLGTPVRIPANPEALPDPKATLLNIAQRGSKSIRRDLLAEPGAASAQGIGYNVRLCDFVRGSWKPSRAARKARSLERACLRISELSQRLGRPSK